MGVGSRAHRRPAGARRSVTVGRSVRGRRARRTGRAAVLVGLAFVIGLGWIGSGVAPSPMAGAVRAAQVRDENAGTTADAKEEPPGADDARPAPDRDQASRTEEGGGGPVSSRRPRPAPAAGSRTIGLQPVAPAPEARAVDARDDSGRDDRRSRRERRPDPADDDGGDVGDDRAVAPRPDGARVWPVPGGGFEFTQAYGCVPQLGGWYDVVAGCPANAPAFHTGVDLAAPMGTPFYAAASGWVIEAGLDREVGLANTRILIQHDGANEGYATEYLHWNATYVEPGDYVRAGQPIGEVGSVGYSTGPHLHFGVVDFDSGERIDPMGWLPRDADNGAYAGLPRGSVPIRIDGGNGNLPDYADPSPPPVPRPQPVPETPPTEAAGNGRRDESIRSRQAEPEERSEEAGSGATGAEPTAGEGDAGAGGDGEAGSEGAPPPAGEEAPPADPPAEGGGGDGGGRDGQRGGGEGGRDGGEEPAEPIETAPPPPSLVGALPQIPAVSGAVDGGAEPAPDGGGGRDGGGENGGGRDDGGGESREDRRAPKG